MMRVPRFKAQYHEFPIMRLFIEPAQSAMLRRIQLNGALGLRHKEIEHRAVGNLNFNAINALRLSDFNSPALS